MARILQYKVVKPIKITIMAAYEITATIRVYDVRSKRDAINELQVMLNDYEDMNPDNKEIIIHWDNVEKVSTKE